MSRYVYFIKPASQPGPIKIGCSGVPRSRLVNLEVWSPMPLDLIGSIEGDEILERRLHALLAEHHSHGEWFHAVAAVRTAVAAAVSGTLDLASLPAPIDIRAKSGTKDKGAGALSSILTRTIDRLASRGVVIPAPVSQAMRRFGDPLTREIADAAFVASFLFPLGAISPGTADRLKRLGA